MSKSKKALMITASVLFVIIIAAVICCFALYIYADTVRFDYVDCNVYVDGDEYEQDPESNGYSIRYPFFGNSATLGEFGSSYSFPFGGGEKNTDIYMAINDPIKDWARVTVWKYSNRVNIGYTVENDGKTLTVTLSGTAEDGGETVDIEKVFIFDIEDASAEKLPVWSNRTEEDDNYLSELTGASAENN